MHMYKIVVTHLRGSLVAALFKDNRMVSVSINDEAVTPLVNSIYLGRVRDVRRSMGAAFIELDDGRMGYLNLDDPGFDEAKVSGGRTLRAGDEFPVQVIKEGTGEKYAAVTASLTLPGRYVVVNERPGRICVSSRIKKKQVRKHLKDLLLPISGNCGFTARTNCEGASDEAILSEAGRLSEELVKLRRISVNRTAHSLLYAPEPAWMSMIRDLPEGEPAQVVTDIPDIAASIQHITPQIPADIALKYHEDKDVSLSVLYRLETSLDKLRQKKVWLDSGAFIVIDRTEALVSIDVNFGKSLLKKDEEESCFLINSEAARELVHQMRLRNLAGIIIVDFINMKDEKNYERLREVIEEACADDPCRMQLVDFTQLGLAEFTRKKTSRPVVDQLFLLD
jgi:ribonuclease G